MRNLKVNLSRGKYHLLHASALWNVHHGCLWAGISRIVYGAGRNEVHHIYFESRHNNTVDFIRDAFRNDLEIAGGVLAA
jgi:hypothetical protein